MEKRCPKCGETKSLGSFHNHKGKPFGKAVWCKLCARLNSKSHYKRQDPELRLEKKRAWQDKNRGHVNQYNEAWRKANPEKHAARQKEYQVKKKNAVPPWLDGPQKAHIKRLYRLAWVMSDSTGKPYHVDHIVPLQGKNVCGLHVPWNLQVLEATLNIKKSNTFEEDW
jgi:phage FluMu protein Com